jgi:hypothetical protein
MRVALCVLVALGCQMGCTRSPESNIPEVESCNDVTLCAVVECYQRGSEVYADVIMSNVGAVEVGVPKYELVQSHDDDSAPFSVKFRGEYLEYRGTQYQYDSGYRREVIVIAPGEKKRFRWRLDKSRRFSESGRYWIQYTPLISVGKIVCRIDSRACECEVTIQ